MTNPLAMKAGDGRSFGLHRPENYGAIGDGTTDDTTALQTWLNALASSKGRGELRGVTYKTTAGLTCNSDAIKINGAGSGATTIAATGSGYDTLSLGTGAGDQVRPTGYLRGVTVRGPSSAPTSGKAAVKINGLNQFQVEDVVADYQDIGFDLVANCYGAQFTNIRSGFGGSVNIGVNLRTGSVSGSDITFVNPWVAGKIAGVHCSGGGGGWHFFGGQIAGGNGTTTDTDTSGSVILGKDYLTGATGEVTIDFHGTSFEGTNHAWIFRTFDQIHLVANGCSFTPADGTKPAIGVWKATNLKNGRAEFYSSGISGYYGGPNLLSVENTYYTSNFLIEVGTYTGAQQPTIAGAQVYLTSMAKQSGLSGNALTLGLNDINIGGVHLRNDGSGKLQVSADENTWTTLGIDATSSAKGLVRLTGDLGGTASSPMVPALATKADLVNGVVPTSQLPAIALETAVQVANRTAMLALTSAQVQPGDVAIDTSNSATRGSYVLVGADPSQIANWLLLNAPLDSVQSVNGQQGTVVLGASDVGAAPASLSATVAGNTTLISRVSLTGPPVVSTANGTLTANAVNLLDATTGAFTATLPTPAAVGQLLEVERIDTGTGTISIGGTVRGVTSAVNLPGVGAAGESMLFVAESLASWRIVASHKPKALLDRQYMVLFYALAMLSRYARVLVGNNNIAIAVANRTAAGTGRSVHVAAYEMTDLALIYTNFYSATVGVDTAGPGVYPIQAWILYGGVAYPVTFGGAQIGNVAPGGTLRSDRIGIDIPQGATYEVLTFIDSTNWYSNKTAYSGTGNGGFTAGATPTLSVADSVGYMYAPSAIEGTPTDPTALTVAGMGDSIMQGTGDGSNGADGGQNSSGNGGGWLARALYKKRGYLMLAKGSERGDQFITQAGHVRRFPLASGALWAVCSYGRNDLSQGPTLATVQATLITHWRMSARRGMKTVQTTITPYTSSTDAWATTTNQTLQTSANETVRVNLNTWLRAGAPINTALAPVAIGTAGALIAGQAGHPLTAVFDLTAVVESGLNTGLWAASTTTDGLHPNTAGHTAIAAAFATVVTNTLTQANYVTAA